MNHVKKTKRLAGLFVALATLVSYQTFLPIDSAAAAGAVTYSSFTYNDKSSRVVNGVPTEVLTPKYTLEIEHPVVTYCSGWCSISVRYRFLPGSSTYAFENIDFKDSNTGKVFDSNYFSYTTTWTNKTFDSYESYTSNLNLQMVPDEAYSWEKTVTNSTGSTKVLVAPTPNTHTFPATLPDYITGSQIWVSKSDDKWTALEYRVPTKVTAFDECQLIPFDIATIDVETGQPNTWASTEIAIATITLYDPEDAVLATTEIGSGSNEWTSKAPSEQIATEVCGLNIKKGTSSTYSYFLKYSITQAGRTFSNESYLSFKVSGGVKFTKINCLKGTNVKVVEAADPKCPTGYKVTNLAVSGNRLVTRTINCLKGTTVKVVTAPSPSCPTGYSKTSLPVKNGKLQPQTITCVKGLKSVRVTKVMPTCPAGYRKA